MALSFKTFLTEKWYRGSNASHLDHHPDLKKQTRKYVVRHEGKVGPHKVQVNVIRRKGNFHDLSFSVNKDFGDDGKPYGIHNGHDILDHVHKVISHYIKKAKPPGIQMQGNTPQKKILYQKYAKHLANKFGGTHDSSNYGEFITFKHNIKESFLFERKRSIEQATKLGLYIAKRHKANDLIKDKSYRHRHALAAGMAFPKLLTKPTRQKVEIKGLKTTQAGSWFTKGGAHHKMQDTRPIRVMKLGKHHFVVDGHHRLMAAKLRGETHIDADVH